MSDIKLSALPNAIPPEVIAAANTLDEWAKSNRIGWWQIMGVCSRAYAMAIQEYVPNLVGLPGGTHVNGGRRRAEQHNRAVTALRSLVVKKELKIVHLEE